MKNAFALALSLICAATLVAAQAPAQEKPAAQQPAAQQPSTPSPSSQSASAGKVTYVGCLKPGTSADSWVLENAEKGGTASASSTSPSTPSTAATAGGSKMTFGLTAKPTENLKPHANHKIEVTGTVSAASPSGAGASAGAAAGPRQNITVESVKMVSATCP